MKSILHSCFQFNNLKTILDVRVIYGGIRGVIDEGIVTSINSETIKSAIYGADFGLISIINKKGKRTVQKTKIILLDWGKIAGREQHPNKKSIKDPQAKAFKTK